jgi:hypothetical protein
VFTLCFLVLVGFSIHMQIINTKFIEYVYNLGLFHLHSFLLHLISNKRPCEFRQVSILPIYISLTFLSIFSKFHPRFFRYYFSIYSYSLAFTFVCLFVCFCPSVIHSILETPMFLAYSIL